MRPHRTVSMISLIPVVAGVLLVGSGSTAVAAGAIRSVPANVNLSKMLGNQSETTVAINPTNPKNVVVVSNTDATTGLFEGYTTDGGATWNTSIIADGDSLGFACCDPSLAFDPFGNLFLVFLKASLPNNVPVALSTNGGATFSILQSVIPPATGPAAPFPSRAARSGIADQPTVTAGQNSAWLTFTAGSGTVVAAGASVTGLGSVGSFGAREAVPTTNGRGDFGDIAIGPSGQVLVTYEKPTGQQTQAKLYVSRDPDGLGPQSLSSPTRATKTNVGGFDYIPAQAGRSVDAEAGLAYDRTGGPHNGRVYLMYTQETPDESNNMDVLVRHSDDDGATWSAPVRVNDDTTTNSQFLPKLALDPTTGNLAVSWYDARNDQGTAGSGDTDGVPNDDAQFFASFSTDGGASFLANIRVSKGTSNSADANNGIDFGDYTGLGFYGGKAWPAWADNSNSTGDNPNGTLHELDVYTAKVKLPV
jgi:hypothetical protein